MYPDKIPLITNCCPGLFLPTDTHLASHAQGYPYRNKEHMCSARNCWWSQDGLPVLRWRILPLRNDISERAPRR